MFIQIRGSKIPRDNNKETHDSRPVIFHNITSYEYGQHKKALTFIRFDAASMSDLSKDEALYGYRRLQEIEVVRAVGEIKETMQNIEKQWDEEVSKYEETVMIQTDDRPTEQLRRNYRNPAGIIEDPSLFPYHSACYALLDCYDTHDDESDQDDALTLF
jgi:hypothetical protein